MTVVPLKVVDPFEQYVAGNEQADLFQPTVAPILVDVAGWSEADIPVRPWVAPGYLMRGAVTVLSGPGSAGKSSLCVAWAIALALGERFAEFRPADPMTVLLYNVEDDHDEQRRRLSAALRQFDAKPSDLAERVIRVAPGGAGTLLRRDPLTGRLTFTRAMEALDTLIAARRPDVIVLDPLVELHDAEENDNQAIRMVMARLRQMAQQYRCAILLCHHARKGSSATPGDPDTLRGASAIVGAARVVLTLTVMSEEEAKTAGLKAEERFGYFRLDGAKSNYAPLHDAEWFQRISCDLVNGEQTAAATPWKPTSPWKDVTIADANAALDVIAAGRGDGVLYALHRRGFGGSRWAGSVLVERFGVNEEQAATMLAQWAKSGVIEEQTYRDPTQRKDRSGLVVINARRPA